MKNSVRRLANMGAALVVVTLPAVAPAQDTQEGQQSYLTRSMGIDQKLGASVPKDPTFLDETGVKRTFGSVFKGRPVLVLPLSLTCNGGCHLLVDGLEKTLFHTAHPNEHKVIQTEGRNRLTVGKDLDVVLLSIRPTETPVQAAKTKAEFQKAVGYAAEPVTVFTGTLDQITKVTDAIGFRFFYDPQTKVLRNATGSVLLTADGRVSSYTIANDFPTVFLERNLEIAQDGRIGSKADTSRMFGCIDEDPGLAKRRDLIENYYKGAGLLTLAVVVGWIGSMIRKERRLNPSSDLGGQPGGA